MCSHVSPNSIDCSRPMPVDTDFGGGMLLVAESGISQVEWRLFVDGCNLFGSDFRFNADPGRSVCPGFLSVCPGLSLPQERKDGFLAHCFLLVCHVLS